MNVGFKIWDFSPLILGDLGGVHGVREMHIGIQIELWLSMPICCLKKCNEKKWPRQITQHTMEPKLISCPVKSRSFKNRELYWSNLPQNSNFGQEFVQKSGFHIPVGEGQIFLSLFLFIFIFSIKNWILTHKILICYLLLPFKYQ